MYSGLFELWFSKDEQVQNIEKLVCMSVYSDRYYTVLPAYK